LGKETHEIVHQIKCIKRKPKHVDVEESSSSSGSVEEENDEEEDSESQKKAIMA
jgi:hypothetical protein